MSEDTEKIQQVMEVTQCRADEASRALHAVGDNVQAAISHVMDNRPKFGSLSSARNDSNEYYAGGQSSGIAIAGGPDEEGPVDPADFFKAAQNAGAISASEYKQEREREAKQRQLFAGTGYRLGDDVSSSEPVVPAGGPVQPEPLDVKVTIWKEGFSVDDGENPPFLRRLDDPKNRAFMDTVSKGYVPPELQSRVVHGQQINVELMDRRTESFVPPKPQVKAFAGTGHRLGNPTNIGGSTASSSATSASATDPSAAQGAVSVDESKPTTKVQVRLINGTRLAGTFNLTHTVGDIRRFILAASPSPASFSLVCSFPRKNLSDDSVTIEAAGLQNAALLQRPA